MIHEAVAAMYGVNTYVLYLVGPPAIIGMLLSGGVSRVLESRPTLLALGFAVWMLFSTPFSAWKGGSLQFTLTYFRTEVPMLFLIAGLVTTWKECVAVANTIAMASIVSIGLGRLFAMQVDGRFSLSIPGSSISNSNDYAAHLILVLGFLLAFTLRRGWALRLLFGGVIAFGVYLILLTASRGAMLALIAIGIYLMVYATPTQRVASGIGLFVGGVFLFSILPAETRGRLTNFSRDKNDEASESAQSREYLLRQGIRYAFENPLFGVGPGQFASYEGGVSKDEGRRGQWHEAHNSYVQAAAECGFPAMFLFIGALISGYRMLSRTFRRSRALGTEASHITVLTFCLMLGVFGFCIAIGFLNFYPKFYLLAIVSYAVALHSAAEAEFARIMGLRAQRAPAAPANGLRQDIARKYVIGRV